MADSDALRQQRRRHHVAGDHSMCGRNCQASWPSPRITEIPAGSGDDLDPMAALRDLAAGLQEAYRTDPGNALLAKELRMTLLALPGSHGAGVDEELALLMRDLARPVGREESERWHDELG